MLYGPSGYHLYVHGEVTGVPDGVTLKDANEILPESAVFQYSDFKSYAGFSNHFRYELLRQKGGWWADTDFVCLQPFEFEENYVFSSESYRGGQVTNSGVLRAPAGCAASVWLCSVCRAKKAETLKWGDTGPRLLKEAVNRFGLSYYVQPAETFCPWGFLDWERVLDPNDVPTPGNTTYAVHLWNEMWRRSGRDKDASYEQGCLYEQLRSRYLPAHTRKKQTQQNLSHA